MERRGRGGHGHHSWPPDTEGATAATNPGLCSGVGGGAGDDGNWREPHIEYKIKVQKHRIVFNNSSETVLATRSDSKVVKMVRDVTKGARCPEGVEPRC